MLISGDIQFEPTSPHKILPLTSSIVAMAAGDAVFNAEVLADVRREVERRIEENPGRWLTVEDVAELYIEMRSHAKLKRASSQILSPLGLTHHSFLSNQRVMDPQLVSDVSKELINFSVPSTSVIVTGNDPTGLHIYVVESGTLSCRDTIGFAAIGSGARHAESQFMLSRYAWNSPIPDALLLIYTAKKRAERAPGVGAASDMFMIGSQLGSFAPVYEHVLSRLDAAYDRIRTLEEEAHDGARNEITQYVNELGDAPSATGQQPTQIDGGDKASDSPTSDINSRPENLGPAARQA
jgi:hypothetical protein